MEYKKITRDTYEWPHKISKDKKWVNRCKLEVHKIGMSAVVAATDDAKSATSVINDCERLAWFVCREFEIHPRQLIFISHSPGMEWMLIFFQVLKDTEYYSISRDNKGIESIAFIESNSGCFEKPSWFEVTKSAADALVQSQEEIAMKKK
jgi:hypothetical protein